MTFQLKLLHKQVLAITGDSSGLAKARVPYESTDCWSAGEAVPLTAPYYGSIIFLTVALIGFMIDLQC